MNFLARFYPGDEAVRLAVSVALQIAGIVILATAASWIAARRNAALRDGIWRAALALVCAAPLLAWGFDQAGVDIWRTADRHAEERQSRERDAFQASMQSASPAVDQGWRAAENSNGPISNSAPVTVLQTKPTVAEHSDAEKPDKRTRIEAAIGALAAIWAIVAVVLLIRLNVGLRVVERLRHDLTAMSDLPRGVAERLRKTLGVAQLPPITISERIGGPASVGLWRPIVVLPRGLVANASADVLHDTLAHECAHVLRHDARVALVQQIVAAVYWVHPLVYVLNRQLAKAREEVCDNMVLGGTTATDYARTLLALSQSVQLSRGRLAVIPMFDRRWRLARRVAGILNSRRIIMTRMNKLTAALVAVMTVMAGITLAAICAAADQPKESQNKTASDVGRSESHATAASSGSDVNESNLKPTQPKSTEAAATDKEKPASGEPPVVAVSRVVERDVTDFEDFTGNIVAPESVKIVPRVTGYLTSTAFKEGADVKKADKLFEIDPRPFQAEVDRSEAELRVAETHLKFAEAEFARFTQLLKSSAISQEEYNKVQATVQEAQAAMNAAKANLEARRLTLSFCTITSPIDGRAAGYNMTPGNLVKQDETVLTTIVSHDSIGVSFDIDERTWLRLAKMARDPKAKPLSSGGDMRVFVRADDETGFPHEGNLNYIGNEFDRTTGTIVARATIENPPLKSGARLFIPGMHVTVRMMIGQPHKALLVSNEAIYTGYGSPLLSVVDKDNVVDRRNVTQGQLQDDGLRVVASGLGRDERVVLNQFGGPIRKIRPNLVPMPTKHASESNTKN